MATEAQTAANCANAQLSTGPRTPSGKAASAANSLRHGFRSQTVLLPGEDPNEYDDLLDELSAHAGHPTDLSELRLVREMADAEWRLRRARAFQEHVLTQRIADLAAAHPDLDPLDLQIRALASLSAEPSFRQLLHFEEKFERQYDRAWRSFLRYSDYQRRARARESDILMKNALFPPIPTYERPTVQKRTNEPNSHTPAREAAAPPTRETPRNAFCPCNSGLKFKRCCGRDAPPILAASAA